MTVTVRGMTGVWADVVGQQNAVTTLQRAVAGDRHAMTHAWLVTGPPGSGRSNVARAFAAALQCERGGCGECQACRTALSGAHPDVTLVRTEKLSIGVDEVRDLVRRASMSPTLGRHQVLVMEDADRVTDRGADALLKSIEEPAPKTVWLLCAPTPDDVVTTIRSRCRALGLSTPPVGAVADLLTRRDGVDPAMAMNAARAAQGHIGRARVLALHEDARDRRRDVLQIPRRLTGSAACLTAAQKLVDACAAEAKAATEALDAAEREELGEALGFGTKGAKPKQARAAMKELEDEQKVRAKRMQRDALDRALTELTTYYRDVVTLQLTGEQDRLVNPEIAGELWEQARGTTPEASLRRIDALLQCREELEGNVAPLLAVEALLIKLMKGWSHGG